MRDKILRVILAALSELFSDASIEIEELKVIERTDTVNLEVKIEIVKGE